MSIVTKIISAAAACLLVASVHTQADDAINSKIANQLSELKTFDGKAVTLTQGKLTHLVFQDAWASYGGQGEEARVAALPELFLNASEQVWVQPEINITEAQLHEYQGYFPKVTPLVLDRAFTLMRSLGSWDLPLHVIVKDGQQVFSGNGTELQLFTGQNFSNQSDLSMWLDNSVDRLVDNVGKTLTEVSLIFNGAEQEPFHKPKSGDLAPEFLANTMKGDSVSLNKLVKDKTLSLVFIDSLCPMPQFPGCEAKLQQLNEIIAEDDSRQWLGVVSSYYVSEDLAVQFGEKFKLQLPLVFDKGNAIYQDYGVHATPYQIDIARGGKLLSRSDSIH